MRYLACGQPGQGPSEENSGSLVDERQGYDAAATKRIKLPKRAPTARSWPGSVALSSFMAAVR